MILPYTKKKMILIFPYTKPFNDKMGEQHLKIWKKRNKRTKDSKPRCFPAKFPKFLRTPFLTEHLR